LENTSDFYDVNVAL